MQRSTFLAMASAASAAPTLNVQGDAGVNTVAGIPLPDSTLAREAAAIAKQALPAEIYNHSLRTYLFAYLVAREKRLAFDEEAVYVASILHDAGLSKMHMSAQYRFEVDGARVAKQLLTKHRVEPARIELVWDAITLHDSDLAQWKQPEVQLVSDGVDVDFGEFLDVLRAEDVLAVLHAAPRTQFVPVFLDAVAEVARKKPLATGKCFVTDVGYRMVPGFHLPNFCDEVRNDPFATLTSSHA